MTTVFLEALHIMLDTVLFVILYIC